MTAETKPLSLTNCGNPGSDGEKTCLGNCTLHPSDKVVTFESALRGQLDENVLLRAENARLQKALSAQQEKLVSLADKNNDQAETIAKLRTALEGWGNHVEDCGWRATAAEVRRQLREALKEER